MSGGKSCLVAPGVAVPPWATKTVITPGWQLMRTGYRTCFHTLYDEKKNTLPMGVEHSGEGIVGRCSHNAKSSSKELSTLAADRVLKCKQTDAVAVAT